MQRNEPIVVFGAAGHTGRFVVAELRRRGFSVVVSGRDAAKLRVVADMHPGSEVRVASVDDPASLDRALAGAGAVINCAGPFLDTAAPAIEAALRARIHYLDLTAEQPAVLAAFDRFGDAAQRAGIVVAPATAFYGGLSDLLATAAMGDWDAADEVNFAGALDSWMPKRGTRLTGQRNTSRRFILSKGRLEFLADPPPTRTWSFPAPFGAAEVVGVHFSETILISRHLRTPEIRAYLNLASLRDVRDPATPAPTAADDSGRSSQIFVVDVIVRRGSEERRAMARGRDIYAVTAPIVVEAAERILDGRFREAGALAPGALFDALDFLRALSPEPLSVDIR